jgi:hypothetical protein
MRHCPAFISTTLALALAGSVLALAPPAMAAVDPQTQTVPDVKTFLTDPQALLTQFPNGGPDMVKAIQALANDPSTLNAVIGLLSKANSDQATAIGTALGNVAKTSVTTPQGQAYATQIQVAVALANNETALGAFNKVIGGDIQLTAVTGGVGGGGGGGGGPTNTANFSGGNGSSNPFDQTSSATNTADSFTNTALSPASSSNNSTINNDVSATTP